jgi:hypothetical protein
MYTQRTPRGGHSRTFVLVAVAVVAAFVLLRRPERGPSPLGRDRTSREVVVDGDLSPMRGAEHESERQPASDAARLTPMAAPPARPVPPRPSTPEPTGDLTPPPGSVPTLAPLTDGAGAGAAR